DGSIWIGTSGGLTRVRDGRLVPIRAEQGLPGEMVIAIEQAGGDLWIVTGSGISRMTLSELDAVADGRAQQVHPTTLGTEDGLAGRGGGGGGAAVVGGQAGGRARVLDGGRAGGGRPARVIEDSARPGRPHGGGRRGGSALERGGGRCDPAEGTRQHGPTHAE